MDRRTFLGAACSAAASPLMTPVTFAAAPGDDRMVVIVLRGALDALGLLQPHGDRDFAKLRPRLARAPGPDLHDLDGRFGLAGPFKGLLPLWQAGELGVVAAVSTPYRGKRSHFDGQDVLENGSGRSDGQMTSGRDGWLNRAVSLIPGARAETAMAVGEARMLLLDGDAPHGSWSPKAGLGLMDDERGMLDRLFADDPLFGAAFRDARRFATGDKGGVRRETGRTLAAFAAERLAGPARIAAFSLGGWDTHRRQDRAIQAPARQLTDALLTLKQGLGAHWSRTMVLCVTEFGRTARENGSGGTDHGTGGAMLLAGGAIRGGKVHGRWPGLGEGALFEDRDLMPTGDVRRYAAWTLAAQFGLDRSGLERTVFPGLEMEADPGILR